jgi:hypothetical protein
MLLNINFPPWEEYFLHSSSQADDFTKLKKQCHTGWTFALNHVRVWTMPYAAEKLTLLLVLLDQLVS